MVLRAFALARAVARPRPCLTRCGWRPTAGIAAGSPICVQDAALPQPPKWRGLFRGISRGLFALAGTCAVGFCYADELASYVRDQVARFNGEELRTFDQHFANVMPHGEFEKLMRAGQRVHTTRRHVAIRKGDENAPLILVIDGSPEIEVEPGITVLGKPGLVGEMSFLTNAPTSASVYMTEGCRYHIWGRGALRALLRQERLVKAGLEAKAGHDLIDRLTQSTKDLVRTQYSLVVVHTALQYLLHTPRAGSGKFFAELAAAREKSGVSEDVHRLVMEDFNISEEAARLNRLSIAVICASLCNQEVLQQKPEPPIARIARIISDV